MNKISVIIVKENNEPITVLSLNGDFFKSINEYENALMYATELSNSLLEQGFNTEVIESQF